jgi:hypothetical protein
LSWTAPDNDGGSPVTDYVIQYSTNNGATWNDVNDTVSTSTTVVVRSLMGGQPYVFRVIPINLAGRGDPSEMSASFVPASPASIETPAAAAPTASPVETETASKIRRRHNNQSSDSQNPDSSAITDDDETVDAPTDEDDASQSPDTPSELEEPTVPIDVSDENQSMLAIVAVVALIILMGLLALGIAGFGFNTGPLASSGRRPTSRFKK